MPAGVQGESVARNYAEALLTLALKAEDAKGWGTMLRQIANAIETDITLFRFLESPRIAADQKSAVLTKALGTGILATALKKGLLAPDHRQALLDSLLRLNRHAARCMQRFPVHAATDITGFALGGHGAELASASQVRLRIDTARLPLLPGLEAAVAAGCLTRGDASNRLYAGARATVGTGVTTVRGHAVFDPQSSGGLLIAVAANAADELVSALREGGDLPATVVGEITTGAPGIAFV